MITINSKELKIGMYVSGLDRPWEGTPFLFQGFLIEHQSQITQLQKLCKNVQIDTEQSDKSLNFKSNRNPLASLKANFTQMFSKPAPPPIMQGATKSKANFTRPLNINALNSEEELLFEEELEVAKDVYQNTSVSLHNVLESFRLNKNVSKAEVESCVNGIIINVMRNPNALLLLTNLKSKQQDTVRHSINVSVLCLLFARHLNFDAEQLSDLGFAALLHDVGEAKVPQAILDKHNRGLSPEEKIQMEKHAQYGAEMLRANAEIPAIAAEVAYSHHERINGKGYPRGLKGEEINLFSRLLSIVDVYETVTNYPGAKVQITPASALKSIYSMCNSFFDQALVESFIKCLGVYPVGSVVRLNNGEIGIVIDIKPGKHLLPTLMLVQDSQGKTHCPPKVINLDTFRDKEGLPKLLISKVVDPSVFGIDLSEFLVRATI